MRRYRILQAGLGCVALTTAAALAVTETTEPLAGPSLSLGLEATSSFEGHARITLTNTDAKVAAFYSEGRIRRVYGEAFSNGATPADSALKFMNANMDMVDAEMGDIVPFAMADDGSNELGVYWLPDEQRYKFTALYYHQVRDGVPVYGSRIVMLVRNDPGFPLVLANPDVRPLGGFRVGANDAQGGLVQANAGQAMAYAAQMSELTDEPHIHGSRRIIWAGRTNDLRNPVLADETTVHVGVDEWRIITDARTGALLDHDRLICTMDVAGTVEGLASLGPGADICETEQPAPMPYLLVTGGGASAYTDVNGNYALNGVFGSPVSVSSNYDGRWFDVFDQAIAEENVSGSTSVPGTVDLLYNAANNNELIRAQTNAYIEANRVRDYVVAANPNFPTIQNENFPVNVNNPAGGLCPGNAWYSPSEVTINFCQSGSSNPNTAWTSVVHHEFGHHIVQAGGSGQGQYGEGMGDVMSTIILDDNRLGLGFFNDCGTSLRDADNDIQYPCSGAIHSCGQLISGCVWDTRNALTFTEPANYTNILASLAINSVLLHSGDLIQPDITVDWLVLDDDNETIFDGTPHYNEINTGFSLHNMDGPELALLGFSFPNGLPEFVDPSGDSIRVEVNAISGTPQPNTGQLFYDDGTGAVAIPMTQISPNVYDAIIPPNVCGTPITYYFDADATNGQTQEWPPGAPAERFGALTAIGLDVALSDDYETDLGYTVEDVDLSDGSWSRGVPAGGGDREDPPTDFDGSGACWLTDNVDGNSDVDGGPTRLTSNIIDMSALSDPTVSYARWFGNDDNDADSLLVQISNNGGSSWVTLESSGDTNGNWVNVTYRVADFVTPSANMRLRFSATDNPNDSVTEAGIDALVVSDIICDSGKEPCLGDVDGSGDVSFNDLLAVLSAWGPCVDCNEDIDDSGEVDFTDLVTLLSAWGPCP